MIRYENTKVQRLRRGWLLTATLRPSGNLLQVQARTLDKIEQFCNEHKIEVILKNIQLL